MHLLVLVISTVRLLFMCYFSNYCSSHSVSTFCWGFQIMGILGMCFVYISVHLSTSN